MNAFERRPWFGGVFERNVWLLPLLLGIGIGGFIFGMPRNDWGFHNERRGGHGHAMQAPVQRNESAQQTPPVVPEQAAPRGEGMERGFAGERFAGRHDRGFGFFPFAASRLILPALLIGAGLWFLRGSRGGNGWGGPGQAATQPAQSSSPYNMPTAGNQPSGSETQDPPTTGETRRL